MFTKHAQISDGSFPGSKANCSQILHDWAENNETQNNVWINSLRDYHNNKRVLKISSIGNPEEGHIFWTQAQHTNNKRLNQNFDANKLVHVSKIIALNRSHIPMLSQTRGFCFSEIVINYKIWKGKCQQNRK